MRALRAMYRGQYSRPHLRGEVVGEIAAVEWYMASQPSNVKHRHLKRRRRPHGAENDFAHRHA